MKIFMTLAFVALMTTVSFAKPIVCTPNETFDFVLSQCVQDEGRSNDLVVKGKNAPDSHDSGAHSGAVH